MTPKEATTLKDQINTMQAFLDGEAIEFFEYDGESDWTEVSSPTWNWDLGTYRIKPKGKVWSYEDAAYLLGRTVIMKTSGVYIGIIVAVTPIRVGVGCEYHTWTKFNETFTVITETE